MKTIKALMLAAFLLFLPGCIPSVQLSQRAIVQAVGIDYEGGQYTLTLQIFNPSQEKEGEDTSKILAATGKSIEQAAKNATLKQGWQLFFGHNQLIVIGRGIAEDGIANVVSYFNAIAHSRPNVDMLIADEKAADVLVRPLSGDILPVINTKMMLEGAKDSGKLVRTQLKNVTTATGQPYLGTYLPLATFAGDEKNPAVEITGTAILKAGKMAGFFTPDETRGLLWVTAEVGKTQLLLADESFGLVTVDVIDTKVKIKSKVLDEKVLYEIDIQVKSNVTEEEHPADTNSAPQRYEKYEQLQKQLITREVTLALEKLYHEIGSDALGLCNHLIQQQPGYWLENSETYMQNPEDILFSVSVTAKVNKAGLALS